MKNILKAGLASATLLAFVGAMSIPAFATTTSVQANIQNSQNSTVHDGDGNRASVNRDAFEWATGNVGANVASGNGNQQANALYIDQGTSNLSLASGAIQQQRENDVYNSGYQHANVRGEAFQHVSGNVGLNVAAGNLNQQSNTATILNKDQLNGLVAGAAQLANDGDYRNSDDNRASITSEAFENASGNIGVNVAAGNGNQQANSLVINNGGGGPPATPPTTGS